MHALIAGLYATVIWLAAVLYAVILDGPWLLLSAASPLAISVLIAVLLALDYGLFAAWKFLARAPAVTRWAWRCLSTLRL